MKFCSVKQPVSHSNIFNFRLIPYHRLHNFATLSLIYTYLTKVQYPIKLFNKDPIEENFKENNKIYLKNTDKKESLSRMTLSPEHKSLDWDSFYCT